MEREYTHKPVLLEEVIKYLTPKDGEVFIDCTFGAGGYSRGILEAAKCKVLGLDRDHNVKPIAEKLSQEFGERFAFAHSDFANISSQARTHSLERIDGIVFDVGVSSMQIDDWSRGFSFMHNGPLDMRMDQSSGVTAADIVNTYSEKEIADLLFYYGDERKSFQIAKAIIKKRAEKPFETTFELAETIRRSAGKYNDTIDPATRSFQAIRIAVNDELNQLKYALESSFNLLCQNGRLVVVTFHSGEDRIVKKLFKEICGKTGHSNRHLPLEALDNIEAPKFKELHKGIITATNKEVERNIRARSAKLRAIVKL
jgi:16S rRNA (cytosine1402-N4)-methyltransferase